MSWFAEASTLTRPHISTQHHWRCKHHKTHFNNRGICVKLAGSVDSRLLLTSSLSRKKRWISTSHLTATAASSTHHRSDFISEMRSGSASNLLLLHHNLTTHSQHGKPASVRRSCTYAFNFGIAKRKSGSDGTSLKLHFSLRSAR